MVRLYLLDFKLHTERINFNMACNNFDNNLHLRENRPL